MQAGNRLTAPFFNSPRHWDIEFFVPGMDTKNDFLFKIGKSVITSMDVNHDPNSTVSLHSDGSPVQTTLTLSFQEIIDKNLGVMDMTAVLLCRDHDMPILVCDIKEEDNLLRAANGESVGSVVK